MGVFRKDRLKQSEQVMEQYIVRLYRGLGTSLAKRLVTLKITPNQITVAGFIFVIIASLLFATGRNMNIIFGSWVLFFSLILDFTDGTLARMRNQASMFGDWLDAMMDEFREVFVVVGLCAGLYRQVPSLSVWLLGIVILSTDRMIFRTMNKLYKLIPSEEINTKVHKTFSDGAVFRIIKEFLSVRLFKYTFLVVFAIFNRIYAYMVFIAGYGVLLCLVFLAYSALRIRKKERNLTA
ncbi:MAG: hypothetical protein A2Z72_05475 [Omnitrophica bacterium RBG_13_46_9]|nr:MAG: hypothetical protein A2Z72_05475 [Omnitrophica bacterium RBG_13_46_9]